ncbi:cytochrome P450 4V2-like [Uloborus diversus]|uniref:cytochrome P450 4V2-like n=1 Tax=Uloborus diversus TaxID=327109 RepID=UPI002409EFD5|nr:cytochrome P450 4V2-like [Uloborus diversus]
MKKKEEKKRPKREKRIKRQEDPPPNLHHRLGEFPQTQCPRLLRQREEEEILRMWNHFHNDNHRTNNLVESWHSKINRQAKTSHLNIFAFIQLIQKDEAANIAEMHMLSPGSMTPTSKRPKYRKIDEEITHLKAALLNRGISLRQFMHEASHWIHMGQNSFLMKLEIRQSIFKLSQYLPEIYEKEKLCSAWVAYRPYVLFYKPETIEALLNHPSALDKSWEYRFLHPWLGTGLLTSSGKKWKTRRRLLTPAFHFQILEDFYPIFNEESEILTRKIEKLSSQPWIDVQPLITKCTLDIICETAMGVKINAQSGENISYVEAIMGMADVMVTRSFLPWLWIDFIFYYFFPSGWKYRKDLSIVHSFTRKVIKEKKKSMLKEPVTPKIDENGTKIRKPFLQLLLEHHLRDSSFTEEDIREEVDTFMFEGHDTTAMAISWALFCLGQNPEIQEKLYEEIRDVFQDDYHRKISSTDVKNMKYLDCVLKEALRLYPSVPIFTRELKEDIKLSELNFTVPAGCLCMVLTVKLHRDPAYFPDPDKFDPDRFLPENCLKRHPYVYIPFSAGPRNCVGQRFALTEEKVILIHILRKFKITSLDHMDKVPTMFALTLKNLQPLRVRFTPRHVS